MLPCFWDNPLIPLPSHYSCIQQVSNLSSFKKNHTFDLTHAFEHYTVHLVLFFAHLDVHLLAFYEHYTEHCCIFACIK